MEHNRLQTRCSGLAAAAIAICALVAVATSLGLGVRAAHAVQLTTDDMQGSSSMASQSKAFPAPKISAITAKNGKVNISWKYSNKNASGYQIAVSWARQNSTGVLQTEKTYSITPKSGSAWTKHRKTISLNSNWASVRIRAWKTVNGLKSYSAWSPIKNKIINTAWNYTFVSRSGPFLIMGYDLADIMLPGKATSVKNHNAKVAAAKADPYGSSIAVNIKKPGTAKTKFKCLGKTITLKMKIVKWKAPFKKLVIGNEDYSSMANQFDKEGIDYDGVPSDGIAGKRMRVTANNGWKIASIWYTQYTASGQAQTRAIKNGARIPALTSAGSDLTITLRNKNTGAIGEFSIQQNEG